MGENRGQKVRKRYRTYILRAICHRERRARVACPRYVDFGVVHAVRNVDLFDRRKWCRIWAEPGRPHGADAAEADAVRAKMEVGAKWI